MKFSPLFAAAAFALIGASAASAQVNTSTVVQDGKSNSSDTKQRGHDNLSEKAQFGTSNKSRVQQRGDVNSSSVGQAGGGRNQESTDQRGRGERFAR